MNFVILDFPVESNLCGLKCAAKPGKNCLVVSFLGVGECNCHVLNL